jgi:hypothetical protein
MTSRGSQADTYFQQHRHNTQNTQLLSSDSSGSSWSTPSSFLDPKEKARGLENKTELLSCEETEGNKSTSLDDIPIHHHAFCFPGGIVHHVSHLPTPHPRRGKTPESKAPGAGDQKLFLYTEETLLIVQLVTTYVSSSYPHLKIKCRRIILCNILVYILLIPFC